MDNVSVKQQSTEPADPKMQDAPLARQDRAPVQASPEDANVPMALGFEAANGSNDRRIVEAAYRRGCERGEILGAVIRNLIADTPLDRS